MEGASPIRRKRGEGDGDVEEGRNMYSANSENAQG
jgi:hypothetical protein